MKKGKCTNYGDCDEAGKSFDIEDGQPFECPSCNSKLQEVDSKGKPIKNSNKRKKGRNGKNNRILLFIIGLVVVIGLILALIFAIGDGKEKITEPIVIETPIDTITEKTPVETNRSDTLVIKVEGVGDPEPSDTLVKETVEDPAKKAPSQTLPAQAPQTRQSTPQTRQSAPQVTTPSTSSKNLGYATWTGGLKNGQPHGMGTLTYSTSHLIDSRDSKGRVAQPGEYIVGEWDNGHLVQGRWFKNDGTKEAVIVGKAG